MEINSKPVLLYILEKVSQVVPKNQIVVATSEEETDVPISDFCSQHGFNCYRGSLNNVADRFYKAAIEYGFEYACRINGDNIFLDKFVLEEMIVKAKSKDFSFLSNVKDRTFPKGISVEIVNTDYMGSHLPIINKSDSFKEHVLLYFYDQVENEDHFYLFNKTYPDSAGVQLAIDTHEDFVRSEWILMNSNKSHLDLKYNEVTELLNKYNEYISR